MKKILLLLFCLVSLSASGQALWFKTTGFAQASVVNGYYYWGDWENSNMNLCINLSTDRITIYSPRTQIYQVYGVYNNGDTYIDSSGGANIMFYVIDQDYDKGSIRLRVERNGNSQIYVDFSNVAWVYNVIRTQ